MTSPAMIRISTCLLAAILAACGSTPKAEPKAGEESAPPGMSAPKTDDEAKAAKAYDELSRAITDLEQGKAVDSAWLRGKLQDVLASDPKHLPARFNLAKLDDIAGKQAEARRVYAALHEENPKFAPAAEEVARMMLEEGRIQDAESIYRVHVSEDPNNLTSRLSLARISLQQRRFKEAIKLSREVLQRDATSKEAFRVLARSFYELNNLPMAELVIGRGLKVDENDKELHYTLAKVYFKRDDLVSGVRQLKEVVSKDPKWLRVRAELAAIALKYRDFGNAAQQYEAILKVDEKNRDAKMALAVAYTGMGRYDQAETLFEDLNKGAPNSADVLWNMATLYRRAARFADEVAILEQLKKLGESGLQEKVEAQLAEALKMRDDAAALAERKAREEKRLAAVAASCQAVDAGRKRVKAEAIGNDQERIESGWQLMVEAQQLIQGGDVATGEKRVACAFAILPESEGAKKEACAPMRVMWTQILYQLGRIDEAVSNTAAGLQCDPENPDLLLIQQQLEELKAQEAAAG